jgi:hypothetical protein
LIGLGCYVDPGKLSFCFDFRWKGDVCHDSLVLKSVSHFLSMHNIHPYGNAAKQYLGIIRTNPLPFETTRSEGGIFLEAYRINQACDNNAQKNWNENIKRHTAHALRDIQKGE